MMLSIRTRLTALIAVIFVGILAILLLGGSGAIQRSIKSRIDNELREEHARILTFMEEDFLPGIANSPIDRERAKKRALARLRERYAYNTRPVIIQLKGKDSRSIYAAGGLRNVHLLLPSNFFDHQRDFNTFTLGEQQFRFLVSSHAWGKLAVGKQNQVFDDLFSAARDLLLIAIVVISLVVLLTSRLLARLVMKPVVDVAQVAEAISLDGRKMQLPAYAGNDEFAALVKTLNHMLLRIEEGVSTVRQFTQDAAHELRTPLTVQRGELELLYQQEKLPEASRDAVQKVLDRAIYMSKLVENLLLLAQSDTQKYAIRKSSFRLDTLVCEAADDLEILVGAKPVQINVSTTPVTISGDRQLINRLIFNLIDNAVKFTESGFIKVAVREESGDIRLLVEDSGIGISAEDLQHIFDRFYRAARNNQGEVRGSGLGLAICQWVVEAHGGQLSIDSKLQKGTTVTVVFPKQMQ